MKLNLHRSLLNLGFRDEADYMEHMRIVWSAEFMRKEGLSEEEIAKRVETFRTLEVEWIGGKS